PLLLAQTQDLATEPDLLPCAVPYCKNHAAYRHPQDVVPVALTKVTLSEERELVKAAEDQGRNASEWAREVLLKEARRSDEDVLFTELVAMRMLMVNLFKPLIMGKPVSAEWVTEMMAAIRKEKRKAALEVRQQYDDDRAGR
ncbi:MAG TPA: hypothetical protein VK638_12520, partial [Edaphobacter sp.]|nr:hypothetical protein [Edaphobacter sp.]